MIGLVFVLFFTLSYYVFDPDFGWHLTAGNYYIQSWIPKNDIFTYTAENFRWISHEWLNDYLAASIYRLGGYASLAGFFALIWTLSLVIASRRYNALVLIFTTLSIVTFAGIRPIVWTFLFIAILERILGGKNKKLYYILPIIFIFWANLHGSFVLGLAFLGLWQVFSKQKLPWLPVLLSLLATLINPYGPWVFEEILRTALDTKLRYRISEWRAITLPILSVSYLVIFLALHLVFSKTPLKKALSLPGMLLAMSLSSIRHFPLFVIVSLRYLEDYFVEFSKNLQPKNLNRAKIFIISTIIALPFLIITYYSVGHFRGILNSKNAYPAKAVEYLKNNNCNGNIFNSYNYGGYLIWQLPQHKVYIDGRMPSWKLKDIDFFENYTNVLAKDEFRRSEFNKHNVKCILLNSTDTHYAKNRAVPFAEQITREGWIKIPEASTINYSLFIKP